MRLSDNATGLRDSAILADRRHQEQSTLGTQRASLSIVIPTYNRAAMLAQVVRKTRDCAIGYTVEWIIVDAGSTDHTKSVLAELQREVPDTTVKTIGHGGIGRAKNLGASLAKHDVILFLADDVVPADEDFFRIHAELHAEYQARRFAVLGKTTWPSRELPDVNPVSRHIQDPGGQPLSFSDFRPYAFLDWRFFYTCNVSVKRNLVGDWLREGFAPQFTVPGCHDVEFAYRMSKQPGGLEVFYAPSSAGHHLEPYQVALLTHGHALAGAMAHVLTVLHPELLPKLGIEAIQAALYTTPRAGHTDLTPDYLSAIEGLNAWARILAHERRLGNEEWHEELLSIVFEMAFRQGYVVNAARAGSNFERAYACVLESAKIALNRILQAEICTKPALEDTAVRHS